ncbi:MAG: histidine--tRNA ligase [Woeseia sp.]|nr:histidine--tRNA ligase [Woeseia sp.]|tara:strand:+ start:5406 stop:6677 length:1272 start_codon:yes stop_codon:yes gene_type:complete
MTDKLKNIRGMNDILPNTSNTYRYIESIIGEIVSSYGYSEIRLPLLEHTELFKRSIGEITDIVEKEMYSFLDRNGESLTLRPEATAGVVRAGITNGLLHNQKQKLWTSGPMFRYEKPQQGRYRQFYQFDVEVLGHEGPDIDAELIIMSARIWKRLGISRVNLELNSLGTPKSRALYKEELVKYFANVKSKLDEDSIRRLDQNPLRILDSKNPEMEEIIKKAPVILDYLDEESKMHFNKLQALLNAAGVSFTLNPRLVRGLDYYSRTVFEWVTDALGSQGAICSGGRYDGLVKKLGGKDTPAIGWAIGMERLVALYENSDGQQPVSNADVYLVSSGLGTLEKSFELSEKLRNDIAGIKIEMNLGGGTFKSQMKRADKSGAKFALIIGEQELTDGNIKLKPMRNHDDQISVDSKKLTEILKLELN